MAAKPKRIALVVGNDIFIPLTKGKTAIIDQTDAELAAFTWFACENGTQTYAARVTKRPEHARIYMHIEILSRSGAKNEMPDVDHVDGNGLNNRRSNLQPVTKALNVRNTSVRSDSTSGIKGVFWASREKRWRSAIAVDGKRICLGYHKTKEAAASAYATASAKYHGCYGRTG